MQGQEFLPRPLAPPLHPGHPAVKGCAVLLESPALRAPLSEEGFPAPGRDRIPRREQAHRGCLDRLVLEATDPRTAWRSVRDRDAGTLGEINGCLVAPDAEGELCERDHISALPTWEAVPALVSSWRPCGRVVVLVQRADEVPPADRAKPQDLQRVPEGDGLTNLRSKRHSPPSPTRSVGRSVASLPLSLLRSLSPLHPLGRFAPSVGIEVPHPSLLRSSTTSSARSLALPNPVARLAVMRCQPCSCPA